MTSLAFDRGGAGEPLVLLHPLGTDHRVWRPVRERLERERDVFAVDLPGHGRSPAPADPAPEGLAREVARLLDDLGVRDAHVAGCSLGGWVALELALLRRARTVTAIAPAGLWARALGPKPPVARTVARAARPLLGAALRSGAGRRAVLAAAGSVGHPGRVPYEDAVALVEAYATAPGFPAVNRAMRSGRFTRLEDVRVPVTFAWPAHDRLIARPRSLPPRMRDVDLPGCGHIPMWDDPDAVAEAILAGTGAARMERAA